MFLEIFIQGLRDGLNFLPIVNILIFFIFLTTMGRTRGQVFIIGFFFILSVWVTHDLLIFGAFDSLLNQRAAVIGIRILYLFLALGFVILGCCHLWDWCRSGKDSKISWLNKKIPETQGSLLKSRWRQWGRLSFISVIATIIGSVLMVLSSIAIDDYRTFIDFMGWASGGEGRRAFLSLMIHTFAFTLPIFCVWMFILAVSSSVKLNQMAASVVETSFSKIIAAAIFLSLGLGLGYTVLKS